jgi:hypothetical protein
MDGHIRGIFQVSSRKHCRQVNSKAHCLKLAKAIYGPVQAARQWWNKFKKVLKIIGYCPRTLFIRKERKSNRSYLIIYVDDGGIFDSATEVKGILAELSQHFLVKDFGKMESLI